MRGLVIPQRILQGMLEHCLEEKPLEACGILTGREGRVVRGFATTNIKHSPVFYEVDPAQQEWVLRQTEEQGEELVAIYHSHPTAAAHPSANDIRLAVYYPEAVRVIISLAGPADVRAFRIRGSHVERVTFSSPQDATGRWFDLRTVDGQKIAGM